MKYSVKYLTIAALAAFLAISYAPQTHAQADFTVGGISVDAALEKCSALRGTECDTPGEIKKCEGGQSGKEKCVICKTDNIYSGPTVCPKDTVFEALEELLGIAL